MNIVSQPAQFGTEDAATGAPCVPELYFIHSADCLEYAQAYASIDPTTSALGVVQHYAAIEARVSRRLQANYRRALAKPTTHRTHNYKAQPTCPHCGQPLEQDIDGDWVCADCLYVAPQAFAPAPAYATP